MPHRQPALLRGVVPRLERLVVVAPGRGCPGRAVARLGPDAQLGEQLARRQIGGEQVAYDPEAKERHRLGFRGFWGLHRHGVSGG